jgi:hypothetical protein
MAILQEIPLQAVINQTVTVNINEQLIGITLRPLTVNNKDLFNTTTEYQSETIILQSSSNGHPAPEPVEASSIFMVADITLNGNPIIYNSFCQNGVYLNAYGSLLKGYLFFYIDGGQIGNDEVVYTNFGTSGTHLYYSDYDALQSDFNVFVQNNLTTLTLNYLYGYTTTED